MIALRKSYQRFLLFFFLNDTATTEIYTVMNTLSLHDALPIWSPRGRHSERRTCRHFHRPAPRSEEHTSELQSLITISYAVFCLKKKKNKQTTKKATKNKKTQTKKQKKKKK